MKNWTKGEQLWPNLIYMDHWADSEVSLFTWFNRLSPPEVKWPNNAKVAVQFVLKKVAKSISSMAMRVLNSLDYWCCKLSSQAYVDGLYDGSRAGFWRIHSEFQRRKWPFLALPWHWRATLILSKRSWLWCGFSWLPMASLSNIEVEKQHMKQALSVLENKIKL